jgi:hypothetical protein
MERPDGAAISPGGVKDIGHRRLPPFAFTETWLDA